MHKAYDSLDKLDKEINQLIIDKLKEISVTNRNVQKYKRDIVKSINFMIKNIDSTDNINDLILKQITEYNKVSDFAQAFELVNFKDQQREMLNKTSKVFNSIPKNAGKDFVEMNKQVNQLIASGEVTIERAVTKVSEQYKGVTINYKNGAKVNFKDYLFMVYQTNQGAVCNEQAKRNAKTLGTDIFIYSGNLDTNIRSDCRFLLNKLVAFNKSGTTTDLYGNEHKYYNLSKHGHGEPGGALGIRCTHILFAFVPGLSRIKNNGEDIIKKVAEDSKTTKQETPKKEEVKPKKKEITAEDLIKDSENFVELKHDLIKADTESGEAIKTGVEWFDKGNEEWKNSLNSEESKQFFQYSLGDYRELNEYLYTGDSGDEEKDKMLKNLRSGISRFDVKENIKTYRGMSDDEWDRFDDFGITDSFKSTSTDKEVGEEFQSTANWANDTSTTDKPVEIRVLKGSRAVPIDRISDFPEEAEILIDVGVKYYKTTDENGQRILILFPDNYA